MNKQCFMYGILLPYDRSIVDKAGGLLDVHIFDGRDGKQMIIGDIYESNDIEPIIVPTIDDRKKMSAKILINTVLKNSDDTTLKNSNFGIYYIKEY